MARQPLTVETVNPTRIILNAESVALTSEQFFRLCSDNPDLCLELTARKEIVIMPPSGAESSGRNFDLAVQLGQWMKRDKTGKGFESSAGFTLPNGAVRAPDLAWIRRERWEALSKDQREKFAPICPDFVVEIRSKRDIVRELKAKMLEYIDNGAQLAWLIDPFRRRVYVYRPRHEPQQLDEPESVSADPVLRGFTMLMSEIW
ncbi:MAG: Uma2 family endonuclease [Acidobacteria bacterium]|nr:Uma2 family endonuclease [Acidobacteriota bacterium]